MTIIGFQRTIAEAGRIRIGEQVPTRSGGTRPEKLDTFRLTSADRRRIDEAAVLFGGTVRPWQAPAGPQWEVITTSTAIEVIVPPEAMAFSQNYELWSGGGCKRRCDGETEQLSQQPCLCDPEDRAAKVKGTCDIYTRLSVMIRDLPGLGLWRVDTKGWYAARELAGAVEVIAMAAGRGIMVPARLLLEQRSVIRPGKDGKPQTLRFPVPRLDPGITPGELLLTSGQPAGVPVAALADGAPQERRLTPVPAIEAPRPSIAQQSAPPPAAPPRKDAAPEIPASGRKRSAPAKVEGEDRYWQARAFAEAAERGMDTDTVREIAAGVVGVGPDGVEGFSMSSLTEAQWEQVHARIPAFASSPAQAVADEGEYVEIPEPSDAAPGAPGSSTGPMGAEEFRAFLEVQRIATEYAKAVASDLFPGVTRMTDAQRGELAAALVA